ncbi:MAG: 3-oxoacyl-[acyl-carrier-protein] reductase [Myxococcota bacterium]
MFSLDEKVALVTGASRGIGRGIAQRLAAQGAHVVVGYGKNREAADAVVDSVVTAGGRAEAVGFDMADMAATEASVAAVAKRLGRLDILVANAGISVDALLLRLSEADLDKLLAVNLKGALACAKGAIKPMMRKRQGRIIFISSVVGEMGNAGQVAYAATKAGLLGVTKSLAREYASRSVTVNAVTPGFIATDMTEALPEAAQNEIAQRIPLGRIGAVDDIAAAVLYLASDEAAYVTGHTLAVNGGMRMA